MRTLDELRREIDEVDRGIKELYLRRMAAVNEVAAYKMATGGAVHNPEREQQVLDAKADTYGLPDVYRTIMRRSRRSSGISRIFQPFRSASRRDRSRFSSVS